MELTNTPVEIKLAGKAYKIYSFNDNDHDALDEYVQSEYIRTIRASCNNSPNYDLDMSIAFRQVVGLGWRSEEGRRILFRKKKGTARLIWQVLHLDQPFQDLTIGASDDEINQFFDALFRVNKYGKYKGGETANPTNGQSSKIENSEKQSIGA